MRDNSESLIAIKDANDPEKDSIQLVEAPGSGSTAVAQPEPESWASNDATAPPEALESEPDRPDQPSQASDRRTEPLQSVSARRTASDTRELAPRRASRRREPPAFDPLIRIYALMERERRVGMTLGLAGALLMHGAGAAHGYSALLDMSSFAGAVRSAVMDDVRATYAVEVNKPPPPPPPPEPEPEKPQPQPQPRAPSAAQPQQAEKPPAPAQAAKVLTADPDPSEPLDLTDQGFVSGDGDRFAGGITSATGTSKVAVRDTNAKPGGVVGGKGTGAPPAPPPPKEDLSRPATPASRDWGDCGFPAEADVEQIDFMRLSIVVTVGVDGRAQNVTVLKDPGYGFGNQARQCALRKSYNVGFNAEGKAIVTTTPPFIVTFRR